MYSQTSNYTIIIDDYFHTRINYVKNTFSQKPIIAKDITKFCYENIIKKGDTLIRISFDISAIMKDGKYIRSVAGVVMVDFHPKMVTLRYDCIYLNIKFPKFGNYQELIFPIHILEINACRGLCDDHMIYCAIGNTTSCDICLKEFNSSSDEVLRLSCRHVLHTKCLISFEKCPLCSNLNSLHLRKTIYGEIAMLCSIYFNFNT